MADISKIKTPDGTTYDIKDTTARGLVVANPTLAGTESDLTGLQVNGTKYKVPSGGGGGTPYDSSPAMDGTASPGSSTAYARGDHVHPTDTTRLSTTGNAYRAASIPMGECNSTSTSTAFTATVTGVTELRDGVCMWLKNGVVTSEAGFTININNLGAKPCYGSLAAATQSTTVFNVNYTMLFIYNSSRVTGGCWDIVYGYDSNTTYTNVKLGQGYATCSTAAATVAKTAALSSYTLTANGIVSIKFTYDVPANATLNINSKGAKAMYYRGAKITDGIIKAGDTATFIYSTYYHLISIDQVGGLPTVTSSDNGKVMMVVNGAWAKASLPVYNGGVT